jgi:hypothetical protein
MISKKHFILLFMLTAYAIPISYVYAMGSHNSVSEIICSESCQRMIMLSMLIMGWFTLWYEWERNDNVSFMYIAILLVGIYGLLWMDESHAIHYLFATCVFISMLGFMYHHRHHHSLLTIIVVIQLCLTGLLVYRMNGDIFIPEILLICNFGLYYLCLHFMES